MILNQLSNWKSESPLKIITVCINFLLVRIDLFVNQHHCTKEYFNLAAPIFLYAKVDSAGGR